MPRPALTRSLIVVELMSIGGISTGFKQSETRFNHTLDLKQMYSSLLELSTLLHGPVSNDDYYTQQASLQDLNASTPFLTFKSFILNDDYTHL